MDGDPNNGGKRIFPGKHAAVDPSQAIRRKVNLVARIMPKVVACPQSMYQWLWEPVTVSSLHHPPVGAGGA